MNNFDKMSSREYTELVEQAYILLYHQYTESEIKRILNLSKEELKQVLADARTIKQVHKAIRPTVTYYRGISNGLHFIIGNLYIWRNWNAQRIAKTLKLDIGDVREVLQKTFKDIN